MSDAQEYDADKLHEQLGTHGGLVDSTFKNLGMEAPDKEAIKEALKKAASSDS